MGSEMKPVGAKADLADRRLILAIAAKPLNGLSSLMYSEFVSTEALREAGLIDANLDPVISICEMLADCGVWFGPRRYLETTDAWRQLIPYLVIRNEGRLLTYKRGDDIEEERLRGAVALGFGGHIDLPDARFNDSDQLSLLNTVKQGAEREALEELGLLIHAGSLDCMGLIIANEPMVSRVHVGLVMVAHAAGQIASQEDSQTNLEWLDIDQLEAIPADKQEGWTRVLVPEMRRWLTCN